MNFFDGPLVFTLMRFHCIIVTSKPFMLHLKQQKANVMESCKHVRIASIEVSSSLQDYRLTILFLRNKEKVYRWVG